ncbi:SprT family zinc-dependent metalloprotease [Methylobacterium sp. NEAU 140]|uniref:M48 family metallopeptidase n=1 Tax=Methylobacterium sp. NEAU 140 TaxID=3064945 RepID=UPI00273512E2|nr:SprT family zinc-dependent metalloprotease [Methylobacterium sp. NEAU 140]MDP4023551.1 SprT family zinc-dependent metalloprotease [Methylobacterium sp. NEAU 140]
MPLALLRRPDPDHIEVPHEGALLRVALRRRDTARRITLRVSSATGEVVLTLPSRTALGTAQRFAMSNAGWIAARLARVPERVAFEQGSNVPLRGVPHALVQRPGRGAPRVEGEGAEAVLSVACEPAHLARRTQDFLAREARADIAAAVERYSAKLGQRPARITLRDTRSRWGSCTARGELNFSWRLILAPPMVLDYLVAHEMAHLREMNHSPRFWALLRDLCPHVDAAEAWLKRNGTALHRYG